MKAYEAPEKIYVKITHPISDEYTEMVAFEHGHGIEYTRTDAFIKKACRYISLHQCEYIDFDEFKNYMKGE